MITGLEDIARTAWHLPDFQIQSIPSAVLNQDDSPPPYSLPASHASLRDMRGLSSSLEDPSGTPAAAYTGAPFAASTVHMRQHLFAMEVYLGSFPSSNAHLGPRARGKL